MNIPDTQVSKGESISFTGKIDIESDENLPIDNVLLKLGGSEIVNCLFHPNGTIISGCKGISIEPLGNASFEYGYGYGYGYNFGYGEGYSNGKLIYNFTLNTTDYLSGNYSTKLTAYINSKEFSNIGGNIIIGEAANITDLLVSPACAYETDNLTISANITGSVSEVWIETNISGTIANHTTSQNGDIYSAVVNGVGGQNLSWRFVAKDIFDDLVYGDWNSIYIVKRTSLTINPPIPDGLNGWYVSEPIFTLENSDSSEIYYKWDSTGDILYAAPFGLDDIPNAPPKESAGTLELNYWGNTTCGIEQEQTIILKIDLTNPLIKDLVPENNSVVYNNLRPTIGAYLDEVYQSNSGINKESIIIKLDDSVVSKQTINADSLDVIVRHNPVTDLSEGLHKVSVYAEDNAGRNSESKWMFEINLTTMFNLTVYSPKNKTYNARRFPFDITTTEGVKEIEYMNHGDRSPRWMTLCRDCDEYGHTREKTRSMSEGENNLTIKATDRFGRSKEENITLFVDSRDPRILKTEPRRGFADGNFYVEFREDNPKNLTLYYGNSIRSEELDLENDCYEDRGSNYCEINANLSDYDGQKIEYWFVLEDLAGNKDESKHEELDVDYSPPIINSAEYHPNGRRGEIIVNVTEVNFDEVEYIDHTDKRARWRSLCRSLDRDDGLCHGRITLNDGLHNITLRVTDDAGYETLYQMDEFFTDSKAPRIKSTEPRRGFASGLFEVGFDEENPEELWLNYGNAVVGWRNYEVNLSECIKDRYSECSVNVNLSDYHRQEIEYWFNITDVVGNYDESRSRKLDVDIVAPILNNPDSFWERGEGRYSRHIYFDMSITEENFDEAVLEYDYHGRTRERRLCSRLRDGGCEKRFTMRDDYSNFKLIIRDDAGNSMQQAIDFNS